MAEGARLESVFRVKPNVGSNPTVSAISAFAPEIFLKALKMPEVCRLPVRALSRRNAEDLCSSAALISATKPCATGGTGSAHCSLLKLEDSV